MKTDDYSRKISAKEAEEGFIFILKNKLDFFPEVGNKFELINDDLTKEISVESYPCTCRGPDLPHEHYFIRWEGLMAGDKIKIVKDSDRYLLYVNS
jgi:hypothetical protein